MATRQETFDKLKQSPIELMRKFKQQGVSVGEGLQLECPEKENSWNHPVVAKDFLARDELRLRDVGRKAASELHEFKEDHQRMLLLDDLENKYQLGWNGRTSRRVYEFANPADKAEANRLASQEQDLQPLTEDDRIRLEESGVLQGFTVGTAYRPYQEGEGLETPEFVSEVPYEQLAMVRVLNTIDWRIATFLVSDEDLLMQHVQEGTPAATIQIDLGQVTAEATRYSLGVEIGDSQMNSNIPGIVQGLQRMVDEISVRQKDAFGKSVATRIVGLQAINSSGTVMTTLEHVLDAQTAFANGMVNRALGIKSEILAYIALQQGLRDVQGTPNEMALTRLGNRSATQDTAYFYRNAADLGSPTGVDTGIWLFDYTKVVGVVEYMQGEMDSSKFDPATAMHSRYFARWMGQYTKHKATDFVSTARTS